MLKKIVLGALGALTIAAAPAKAEQFQFNIFLPPTNFMWSVERDWAKQIKDATDGRVDIVFPAQSVAPPNKILDAVRSGLVDGAFMANIFLPPSMLGARVGMLPWVHTGDTEAASVAAWETYQKFFASKEKWPGVKLVGMFELGANLMCSTTDKPLTSVEDLRHRKVWALPGGNAQILQRLGVAVTASPAVQIFELVSRNVVEAYSGLSEDTIVDVKVAPYTKSCLTLIPAMQSTSFSQFFSTSAWNRISPQDQQKILTLSGSHLAHMEGKAHNAIIAKDHKRLLADGVTFTPIAPEFLSGLKAAAQPMIDNWIKAVDKKMGVDGKAAYAYMRDDSERLTKVDAQ